MVLEFQISTQQTAKTREFKLKQTDSKDEMKNL
jgi:hypothetical protein